MIPDEDPARILGARIAGRHGCDLVHSPAGQIRDLLAAYDRRGVEIEQFRQNKSRLAAAYHSLAIEHDRIRDVLQTIGERACAKYYTENCVDDFPDNSYDWCGPCVARKALGGAS